MLRATFSPLEINKVSFHSRIIAFLLHYKPIGATLQRPFFGEEGGAWYEKGVTLCGLRISEKKQIFRKLTVL